MRAAFRPRIRHIALLLVTSLAACGTKGADAAADEEKQAVVGAQTAIVTAETFTETIGAIGTVEPRAGHFATLSAPSATRVANVMVTEGQPVAKGAALVELEQSGFQAALKSAQATYTSALAARDRLQRLVDQGVSPRKELEQAIADLAKADADVVAARRALELSVLRAPITGVVTRLNTAIGASVDPSQVLVEIADPAAVDIVLSVEAASAGSVRAGDRVTIHPGERSGDNVVGSGEVIDVAAAIDSATRGVAVRVRAKSGSRPLRIGETVFGEIEVATRKNAVVVPLEALVPEEDGFKVFLVDSLNVAHDQDVRVGGKTAHVAEILEGVSAGDRVVTYGAFGVEDGSKIVPPGKEGAAPAEKAVKKP